MNDFRILCAILALGLGVFIWKLSEESGPVSTTHDIAHLPAPHPSAGGGSVPVESHGRSTPPVVAHDPGMRTATGPSPAERRPERDSILQPDPLEFTQQPAAMQAAVQQQCTAAYNDALRLRNEGRLEEALQQCDAVLRLDPSWESAHLTKGTLLARMGRTQEALASLSVAIALRPNKAAGYYERGSVRLATGDAAGALDDLEKAMERNARDPRIQQAYEQARAAAR